ncbi:MAG: GntP family permease [Lachnospiraceae bacterium]|nr:GntP family permease [Lachnospiraceae bacterium]
MSYQIIVIVIAIALLTVLILRGFQMPVASLVISGIVILACGIGLTEGYLTTWSTSFGNFFKSYFILMFLASIFGKVLELGNVTTTLSRAIVDRFGEKYILAAIFIMTVILGFGAVNSYVQIFTMYPIAMVMFKKANLSRRLFIIIYFAGLCVYTGCAWTVGIWNVVPTKYLGTTLAADWVPSLAMLIIYIPFYLWYIYRQAAKFKEKGIGFEEIEGEKIDVANDKDAPGLVLGILPIIIMLVVVNAFGIVAEAGLVIAIVAAVICYWKYLPKSFEEITSHLGATTKDCMGMLANVGAAVAFGGVVTSTDGYTLLQNAVTTLKMNPLLVAAIIVAVMAGIAASAGGGLSIAMPIVADLFVPQGVNPVALHRVCSFACLSLDSLPHNGVLTGLLNYAHVKVKDVYKDVFVVSVLAPISYTLLTILFHVVTNTVYIH